MFAVNTNIMRSCLVFSCTLLTYHGYHLRISYQVDMLLDSVALINHLCIAHSSEFIQVDVVCIQKTKMTEVCHGTVLSTLGSNFDNYVALPSDGALVVILVAWQHCIGPASTYRVDSFSTIQFHPNTQDWWLTFVYGPQSNEEKLLFPQELRGICDACQGPWIVMGDFNLIYKDTKQ